jgi:signal transduction histidine kinase
MLARLSFFVLVVISLFLILVFFVGAIVFYCVDKKRNSLFLLAYIAVIEILLATLFLGLLTSHENTRMIHRMVQQSAKSLHSELYLRLHFRLLALSRMAKRFEQSPPSRAEWEADAKEMAAHFLGYQSIEWVDKYYRVHWSVPSEDKILKEVSQTQRSTLLKLKVQHQVSASGSIAFLTKGRGFLLYVPVYVKQAFQGYIVGVVNYQKFFIPLIRDNSLEQYSILIKDKTAKVFQYGNDLYFKTPEWIKTFTMQVNNLRLTLRIAPAAALISNERSFLPWIIILLGVLSSFVVILLTAFAAMFRHHAKKVEDANKKLNAEIAERKVLEASKERLKQAFLQSQKMEAVGTLAGGIAHNFNNILYAISGYVSMARDDVKENLIVYQNLSKVLKAVTRGQELVNNILSFGRRQSYTFSLIKVVDVIEEAVSLLAPTLPKTINFETAIHLKKELVYGNHTQLEQVILNIVSNACDAMQGKGVITLGANVVSTDLQLRLAYPTLAQASQCVELTISDTGSGLEKESIPRIFEPFYTTKEVGKGTGLGLATAHAIVRDHQGEIIVESEQGRGATFKIMLPLYMTSQE